MIFKYILFAILDILCIPFNWFAAPVVALFATKNANGEYWLPKYLWYFQTPDNPLNGDRGFKNEHRWFLNDKDVDSNKFKVYANHVLWLYRNCMYGFAISVLGCTIKEGSIYSVSGFRYDVVNPNSADLEAVGNRPLVEGLVKRRLAVPLGNTYFQWYYVRGWLSILGTACPPFLSERCIRINLGWKLWNFKNATVGESRQLVFSPNPLMGCSFKK